MSRSHSLLIKASLLVLTLSLSAAPVARAQDKGKKGSDKGQQAEPAPDPAAPSPEADAGGAERVNVEGIKQKYWARGDESALSVVQNRLYSKEHKLQFSLLTGISATDPFLSVQTLGGSLGFNFTEYL